MEIMTPQPATPAPSRPSTPGPRPAGDRPDQDFAAVMDSVAGERPDRPDPEEPSVSNAEGVRQDGPADAEAEANGSTDGPEAHTDEHNSGHALGTAVQPAPAGSASSEATETGETTEPAETTETGETTGTGETGDMTETAETTEPREVPAVTDPDTQVPESVPAMSDPDAQVPESAPAISDHDSATPNAEAIPAGPRPAATDAAAFRARLQSHNASTGGPGTSGQPDKLGVSADTAAQAADTGAPARATTSGAIPTGAAGATPVGRQSQNASGHIAAAGAKAEAPDQDATTGQGAGGTPQPGPASDPAVTNGPGVSAATPEGATATLRTTASTTSMPSAPSSPLQRPDIRQPAATQLASAVAALQRRGDGEYAASIDLHPAELGRVHVEVEVRAGVVGVRVSAEQAGTRNLLSQQLNDLRAALEQGGLDTGELDLTDHRWSDEQGWSDGQDGKHRDQPSGSQGRATTITMPAPTQATTTTTIPDLPTAGLDVRL